MVKLSVFDCARLTTSTSFESQIELSYFSHILRRLFDHQLKWNESKLQFGNLSFRHGCLPIFFLAATLIVWHLLQLISIIMQ